MCIFANEGGPKSKSSRKETPLKIQKYKEKHVSGKNLEKMFSAPTPNGYWIIDPHLGTFLWPPTSVYALWLHIRKSYSREKKPSTVSCVQASSHRLERPLQYFYQGCPGWSTPDYNIQVGTVFTLIHKNLGKVPKKGESAWKKYLKKRGKVPEKDPLILLVSIFIPDMLLNLNSKEHSCS